MQNKFKDFDFARRNLLLIFFGIMMMRVTSIIFLMAFFLSCHLLHSQEFMESSEEQNYLYAALLESSSLKQDDKSQEEGILSNKNIRIINLGPIVNYKGLDYAPTITADGKTLYFVSDRNGSQYNRKWGRNSHDFWAVKKGHRLDTIFFDPYNIDTTTHLGNLGVNTILNEGAASIAADGQTLYFTACDRPDGLGDCDLYKTTIEGDKWGRPVNLGRNVNTRRWESQPSIHPHQTRLYFTSNRDGSPHGSKNIDIWYCDWDEDEGEWKSAVNLEAINTSGNEVSPFIAADGVTLFFASDGHKPNYGGLDFYVARLDPETDTWSKPQNIGKPINTSDDEQFITLPASGDIIYFSSRRKDLKGYQGDLDLFMAFVPSFFKTLILNIQVVDECSKAPIPAAIHVKNTLTGRVAKDSLTSSKTEMQMIITYADFGNPKDSIKVANFEVTAENPNYTRVVRMQPIGRPPMTQDQSEAEKVAGDTTVIITMGQRPVIDTEIAEADYIKRVKETNPKLASYNGLVMEQVETWDLYPLLNYLFFDAGSSDIPERYILFESEKETVGFTDTTIAGGTLDKYYHLLNIYGYRMKKHPTAKIEIVGCNDANTKEEKTANLSKDRATIVYNYLKDVWGIEDSRMKLTVRNLPAVVSNLKDSLGIVENRRVEILSSEWEIMKPVFDRDPKTFPQPVTMNYTLKNGIEDELVVRRRVEISRGSEKWKTLTDIGVIDPIYTWDWKNESGKYPTDNTPYTAQLIVTTNTGAECVSDPINIPVLQVRTEDKKIERIKDSTLENYSLILFPFDRHDAGPINERIMRDYVYDRCMPNSNIEVIGHTDVVGLYDHNQRLSERRANTVYNGIMKTTKGQVGVISKRGVGEDEPLYNNILPEERFYNRTVHVRIKTPIGEE